MPGPRRLAWQINKADLAVGFLYTSDDLGRRVAIASTLIRRRPEVGPARGNVQSQRGKQDGGRKKDHSNRQ
jgi:hypothetical protein